MAKLAVPIVGAVVGGVLFGPVGAQWGWAIGSAASALMFAPDLSSSFSQEGPRVSDIAAGGSSYGTAIPIMFGTSRTGGNVIWASDLIETTHVSTHSQEVGKGGGGGTQTTTTTTYTYSQHLQVMVCAGEVVGIRKIWANGKLILDASTTNTGATGQSGNVRIYTGTTTQTADSLIESFLGVGNVPGHRGYCYVVFESLQLEEFANRAPNFEFEVVTSGAQTYALATTVDSRPPVLGSVTETGAAVSLPGGRIAMAHQIAGHYVTMIIIDTTTGDVISEATTSTNADVGVVEYIHASNEIWMTANSYPTTGSDILRFSADTGEMIGAISTDQTFNTDIIYSESLQAAVVVCGPFNTLYKVISANSRPFFFDGANTSGFTVTAAASVKEFLLGDAILWTDSGANWANSLDLYNVKVGTHHATITSSVLSKSSTAVATELAFDPIRRRVIWTNPDSMPNVAIIDADTLEVTHTTTDATYMTSLYYNPFTDRFYSFGLPGGGETSVIVLDPDTLQVEAEFTVTSGGVLTQVSDRIMESGLPQDYIMTRTGYGLNRVPISPRLSASQVALSSIVSSLCERAGLDAADIDVTALTDMVDGYRTT